MSTQYLSSERYISMLLQLDHISFNLEPDGGIRNNASKRRSSALPGGIHLHEDPSGAVLPVFVVIYFKELISKRLILFELIS